MGDGDHIQRFVWDGNELLAEIQYPGSDAMTSAQLERDTVTIAGGTSPYFGRVIYLHGEGIDQPISIVRVGYQASVGGTAQTWDPIAMSPRWDLQNRGYDHAFYGTTPSCKTVNSSTACASISWEVRHSYGMTIASQEYLGAPPSYNSWWGSLPQDQQDAAGHNYRRNRYYDPVSGRFTQEDPIGLAGGLNLYGFAAGDPVNYSDPFGLCPWCIAIMNWWLAEGGPAVSRIGAALSGLSVPGSASGVTTTYRSVAANPRAAATIERLTATFEGNIDKLDDMHLDAAAREGAGEVVAWKESAERAYDHLTEVRNAMQGMRNVISGVNRLLTNGRPSEAQAAAAEALKQQAIDALRRAQEAGVTRR